MERMANDSLMERVAEAFADDGDLYVSALVEDVTDPNALAASVALAALGLDDWEAAVDRGGNALADECQDRYGFRMALGQRDILAEYVLRAALTATKAPEQASKSAREQQESEES